MRQQTGAQMVKPLLLEMEMKVMMERIHLPPTLPGEEFEFNEEN